MPATSEKQRRFMCTLANNPKRRKQQGISQQDAMDFCKSKVGQHRVNSATGKSRKRPSQRS